MISRFRRVTLVTYSKTAGQGLYDPFHFSRNIYLGSIGTPRLQFINGGSVFCGAGGYPQGRAGLCIRLWISYCKE